MTKKSRKNVAMILATLMLLVFCFIPVARADSILSIGGSCPSFLIFSTGAIFYLFVIALGAFGLAFVVYIIIVITKHCKRRNTL